MVPHLVQSFLLWLFRSSSIEFIRVLHVFVGSLNAVLVFKVARTAGRTLFGVVCVLGFFRFLLCLIVLGCRILWDWRLLMFFF